LKIRNTTGVSDELVKEKLTDIYNYIRNVLNITGATDFINKTKKDMQARKLPKDVQTIVEYELKNIGELH
jgi:ATP-dependent Lon protease